MNDHFDDDNIINLPFPYRTFWSHPFWHIKWFLFCLIVRGIVIAWYASVLAIPGEYIVEWLGWYEAGQWAHLIAAPAKAVFWVAMWIMIAIFGIMAFVALFGLLLVGYIRLRDPGALRVRHDFPPGPMHPEQLKEIEQ